MSRGNKDLWVTFTVAVLACAAAALRAPVAVTAVLGLVLFAAPGYLLGQLLAGSGRPALERLAVSAGLALCVPVIGGLLLYLARLPLNRSSWLGLLAGVTLVADVLLFVRRRQDRAASGATGPRPGRGSAGWRPQLGQAAVFGLAVLVAAGAVALAREGASVQRYPGFTQLWLVPDTHTHALSLGVANDEGATTRYQLVVLHNGRRQPARKLTLRNGQVWRLSLRFTTNVTAHLYRQPDFTHIYRQVSIGLDRQVRK
jgi:hypothetical protein